MNDFIIRTEDFKSDEIINYYVETEQDRESIETLKSKHPLLLIGSRGVGKTMLLRVAEKEMNEKYEKEKILPVYMSFSKGILVNSNLNKNNFRHWMLSKILNSFRSSLMKKGIITESNNPFKLLFKDDTEKYNSLDKFIDLLEDTWSKNKDLDRNKIVEILGIEDRNFNIINDVDYVKEVIEQFCESYKIEKVVLLFDEACHNFIPKQQREFFTMFRDLRSPYICCKAAVYPGINYFSTLQKFHDVITRKVERNIFDENYIEKMREIVKNQVSLEVYNKFCSKGKEFNALILCSSGNPRLLLKSLKLASNDFRNLKKSSVNETIKEFYRSQIWEEHTKLSNKYIGHKFLIDWGRNFIEDSVLEKTKQKNISRKPKQSIFFTIHIDSPKGVKDSLDILEYSGIISLHTEGTKVRGEIYNRYQINLGVVVASEGASSVVDRCIEIFNGLSTKLYSDYGKNSYAYQKLVNNPTIKYIEEDMNTILKDMLQKTIDILDITLNQKYKLKNNGFRTLYDVLKENEYALQRAPYIGPVRSRDIYTKAYNAAIEYISG